LAEGEVPQQIPEPRNGPGSESRMVLRGVGGQYHGRCFELSRTRLVGRLDDCDIRIDAPAFTDRHARLEPLGDTVALRALAPDAHSLVNGRAVRDALLGPGDQLVFDAHHRFVVEAPGRPKARRVEDGEIEPRPAPGPAAV